MVDSDNVTFELLFRSQSTLSFICHNEIENFFLNFGNILNCIPFE